MVKMSTVKFGFKKTITTNLKNVRSKLDEVHIENQNDVKEYISSIDGTQINGLKNSSESKELVIPMLNKNNWRIKKNKASCRINTSSSMTKSKEDRALEQQAVNEILEASRIDKERLHETEDIAIPLLLRNRIPDGFETDEKLDVSLRAEESSLDDYERVPIEQFGMAMLRGMGWKKSEGIGLKNKRVVEVLERDIRPRGLGLGAERPQLNST